MQKKYSFEQNIFLWYEFKYDSNLLEINSQNNVITDLLKEKVKNVVISKKNIKSKYEKNFDYIIINQLDEYINKNKIDINKIFNKIKKILNKDGTVLFTIKNKYSIKNLCGDLNEDNIFYLNKNYKIYSKNELEDLFKKYNFEYKFYYPFPSSKIIEVLLTDEYMNKNNAITYMPLHYNNKNFIMDEYKLFKTSLKDKMLPNLSNEFLIELNQNKIETKLSFIKFNNYRKLKYNLYTYCVDNKFYKKNISKEGEGFLNEYKESCNELNKLGIKSIKIKENKIGIYTDEVTTSSFLDKIIDDFNKKGERSLEKNLIKYNEYLKDHLLKNEVIDNENTIFDKYDIKTSNEIIGKLHFIKKAFIDIIPQNMLINKNEYNLIDQEWYMKNVPYEYILYRGILSVLSHFDNIDIRMRKYFDLFGITEFFTEFQTLEQRFYDNLECKEYQNLKKYHKYNIINTKEILKFGDIHDEVIIEKVDEINKLKFDNKILNSENEKLRKLLDEILNSKSWKITKPLRKILNIFKRK